MRKIFPFVLFLCVPLLLACAEEKKTEREEKHVKKEECKDEEISTQHAVFIGEQEIKYVATAGSMILKDEQGKEKASIFYVAYTKPGESGESRPITFCFNGGPGSSSVWLHLGFFGPKKVNVNFEGTEAIKPYSLIDNSESILDLTDLVFIDPVSTGYSKAVSGADVKEFHGVDEDIKSVAEFIRLYTTRNNRWSSPKLIAGESYGTTRAAGLALELHDTHHLCIDGILLISSVLNFQTISFSSGNDLPYILFLPTYTATAWYHSRLLPEDAEKPLSELLEESEEFAYSDYAKALMQGDKLPLEERKHIVKQLARFTGLSEDFIDLSNLRVKMLRFAKEILRNQKRTVGRFDSRLKGIDSDHCSDVFEYDPSFENIVGLFTTTFNDYIRTQLNWKKDEEYKILANVWPWNYGVSNQYLEVSSKLKEVVNKNPKLQVYVGSGLTDLATPYLATDYTLSHLDLDASLRSHIFTKNYQGGHMMYLYRPTLVEMKKDIAQFFGEKIRN